MEVSHAASLQIEYPMMFKVENRRGGRQTHCGVLEFIADEGLAYMPYWVSRSCSLPHASACPVIISPFRHLQAFMTSSQALQELKIFKAQLSFQEKDGISSKEPLKCHMEHLQVFGLQLCIAHLISCPCSSRQESGFKGYCQAMKTCLTSLLSWPASQCSCGQNAPDFTSPLASN